MKPEKIIIGITGASGSVYAKQLIDRLLGHEKEIELAVVFSQSGKKVWDFELKGEKLASPHIKFYDAEDFFAPPASGSANFQQMVVVPCSMGTMGRIAHGTSDNLIIRAADVMLKEKRKLILVPRESPYNLIHVKNMELLLLAGADIIPASPSFYSLPQSMDDVVKTVTDKILSQMGFSSDSFEWKGK